MRLIDAEALEESIEQIDWYHLTRNGEMVKRATSENGWYKEQDIYNAIEEAPTIEAKPVVHGRWELEYGNYGKMRCSVCKKEALIEKTIIDVGVITDYVDSNYCPNCGAKMDEKENTQ